MRIALALAVLLSATDPSLAACPGRCDVPGGGPKRNDCLVEFDGVPSATVRCTDGDPSCDTDGSVNGGCRFAITTCLDVADERLKCGPGEITSFRIKNGRAGTPRFDPALAALEARVAATPLPSASAACH